MHQTQISHVHVTVHVTGQTQHFANDRPDVSTPLQILSQKSGRRNDLCVFYFFYQPLPKYDNLTGKQPAWTFGENVVQKRPVNIHEELFFPASSYSRWMWTLPRVFQMLKHFYNTEDENANYYLSLFLSLSHTHRSNAVGEKFPQRYEMKAVVRLH